MAVTATDPSGASVIEHFVFRAKNIAPVATDDLASTNEDTSVTFDVRTNDHDGAPDADALTVSAIDGHGVIAGGASVPVAHGDVTLGLDGKLTFHPAPDFNGSVVFAYTVSDGQGGLATANVQITVLPINDAPTVSAPGTYTTPEDVTKALTGLSFADDAGNANVTVTLSVAHGTLDIDTSVAGGITAAQVTGDVSGTITITAPIAKINATLANATGLIYASSANFNGADALTVTVNDLGNTGAGGPLNATSLTAIAVTPVNDQPLIDLNSAASTTDTLRDNTVIFTEGDAAIHVATVSADVNDIAEADITSLTIVEGSISNGAAEIVSIGGKSFPSHADSTQTATVGGSSVSIAYVASTHAFTITNATGASNPIPQADLDALIRGITYKNTSENPTIGDRTLTFTATDAGGLTSLAAVATITVVPVNDPPAPAADANAVAEDTTLTANVAQGVLSNDTDVDGGALSVTQFTVAGVTGTFAAGTTANIPGAGSLTINADGSYIFVPVSNYNGAVPVATYTVSDGNTGGTSISTLSLTVTPVNDPPHVELQTVSYGVNLITNGDFESGFAGWAGPFVTPASIYQQVSTASGVVTDHTAGSPTGHAALIDTG